MEKDVVNDEVIMYLVVKESLNMSIGKTAAQVGHAVGQLTQKIDNMILGQLWEWQMYKEWYNTGYTKIVLKASDKDFEKLKELSLDNIVVITDLGKTELKPQTETCVGFMPMKKSDRPKLLTKLRLL